jgi:hypothetical protein
MGVLKSLFWITGLLILIFLVSYIVVSDELNSRPRAYFIETTHPANIMNYEIAQQPSGYDMLLQAMSSAQDARRRNLMYAQMEEEIDKCLERRERNIKVTYSKRSCERVYEDGRWKEENCFWEDEKSYFGYDREDEDYLRWKARQKWLNGEKIC